MKKMSDSEFLVMQTFWDNNKPMNSTEILRVLNTTWSPNVVITFMNRLVEKGYLSSQKVGKERRYFPALTKEEYVSAQMQELADEICEGSTGNLLAAMVRTKSITKDDLKKWMDELDD